MEFLEEDEYDDFEPVEAGGGPPRRYGPADHQRQIFMRRAIALGAGILILFLVVLGIKGCLNARKERGFENYVNDLSSVVATTDQLSSDFFALLGEPGQQNNEQSFEAQISAYAGITSDLLSRVENLDTPDQLSGEQSQLVVAYRQLRDGMAGIDSSMAAALGTGQNRTGAVNAIADYMKYFVARDTLYDQARVGMNQVLGDEEIQVDGKQARLPESVFLTDLKWLDPLEVSTALSAVAGGGAATSGTHGTGLLSTTVKPGDVVLTADSTAGDTVSGNGPFELDVSVQNQGESDERNVVVTFQITGGAEKIEGEGTIPRIVAGGTQTAAIPIDPSPTAGEQVTITVTVQPVPGEQLTSNNTATYVVTFG